MTLRLVQIEKSGTRRVAVVEEPRLRLLRDCSSIYLMAFEAVGAGIKLTDLVQQRLTNGVIDYSAVYSGLSEWRLLPAADCPDEPSRCLVTGTGITHLGSAKDRQNMHETAKTEMTDSMKMFRWGVDGGRPAPGKIGKSPEWFYKGNGTILRAHGESLDTPAYADDGGEEAEIAGVYVIGRDGRPWRIGMAIGNEFSDHRFEKKNYLYLAGSKLRTCSLGPELVINGAFQSVPGEARIERGGALLWKKDVLTGDAEMCHSLQNIEHHHFKYEAHRRPGDLHVHYYGAHSLSFGDNIELVDGDVMQVKFEGFGRPLRNPVQVARTAPVLVEVAPLG
jgi:hypothetical protein